MKSKTDLKIGKFIPTKVYKANVDCSEDIKDFFVNLGKEVISEDHYFEIGMIHALEKAFPEKKSKK